MAIANPISVGYLGTVQSKAKNLKNDLVKLSTEHIERLKNITLKYTTSINEAKGKVNEEDLVRTAEEKRDKATEKENKDFEIEKEKLDKNIENILSQIIDPFAAQKLQKLQSDIKLSLAELENKANAAAAQKEIIKKISKALAPIMGYLIGKGIIALVVNNKKLERLVNQTNAYITLANKSNNLIYLTNAKIKRADAVRTLERSEAKVVQIKKVVDTVRTVLTIILLIVSILEALPIIPPPVKDRIAKYKAIAELLNMILGIISPVLQKEINYLGKLKLKLKQIGDILDGIVTNSLDKDQVAALLANVGNNTGFEQYKGFNFAIKTEENLGAHQKIVAGKLKRQFAVAIDRDGVEVLQSDYSFTLDPNDLIEQLKLIIDQRNLQA